jgi:NADPH:quinone reductase-like Zn-dependent oxidoreductase
VINNKKDRFEIKEGDKTMKAVVTVGNGGYDQLVYKDVPIPSIDEGEVLVKVLAAGVNNTEINTRLGWYSSKVTTSTDNLTATDEELAEVASEGDGGWSEATPFPFIQGTDCCGEVVEVKDEKNKGLMGKRVLIRSCIRNEGYDSMENIWMASDFDGAFAQYVKIEATEAFPVDCDWTDAELGTIPCAYVSGVARGDFKIEQVKSYGADEVVGYGNDILEALGEKSVDIVIDNVAGPIVEMDMRDFYLKDLTLIGCTGWDEPVFPNVISAIEKGEIKPALAKSFPLEDIVEAQKEFGLKKHVGKFVLIPNHNA